MPDLVAEPEVQQEERQMGSMSLLQHLEELRKRIIYSLVFVGAGFLAAIWKWEEIFGMMQKPIAQALENNHLPKDLNFLNPTDPFNLEIKIALVGGVFLASPFVLYQVWSFISPGLYRNEKRFLLPFLFLSVGLFLSGGYFGYKVVFPVALDFLIQTGTKAGLKPMITITEYTSLFLTIMLGLAIIFELPIVIGFAASMGVVNAKFLFKHIRGAILTFFIIAAILTPTTDPLNMTIYAAPMVLLYLGSIGIAWIVHPKQRRKRKEKREKEQQQGR